MSQVGKADALEDTSLRPVALPLYVGSPLAQQSKAHYKALPAAQCDCAML